MTQLIHDAVDRWAEAGNSWDYFTQLSEIVEGKQWPNATWVPLRGNVGPQAHVRVYRDYLLRRANELWAKYWEEEGPAAPYDAP